MVLIALTFIFSLVTWDSEENHNESRFVFFVTCFTIVIWIVWTIVATMSEIKYEDPAVIIANLANATIILVLIFVRKMYLLKKYEKDIKEEKRSRMSSFSDKGEVVLRNDSLITKCWAQLWLDIESHYYYYNCDYCHMISLLLLQLWLLSHDLIIIITIVITVTGSHYYYYNCDYCHRISLLLLLQLWLLSQDLFIIIIIIVITVTGSHYYYYNCDYCHRISLLLLQLWLLSQDLIIIITIVITVTGSHYYYYNCDYCHMISLLLLLLLQLWLLSQDLIIIIITIVITVTWSHYYYYYNCDYCHRI